MKVIKFRSCAIALLLVSCASAGRIQEHSTNVAAAVNPLHSGTCPYGDEQKSTEGSTNSFQCHWKSTGEGNTCPELQVQRLKAARTFFADNFQSRVNKAVTYNLKPLFDKSEKMRGDETYEEMLGYHVQGLSHPDVVEVEDKILFKKLAERLGVPATTTLYGAHKDDWEKDADKKEFKTVLQKVCDSGVDGFIIKAIHLAWSQGQKVVKNWQKICKGDRFDSFISDLITFIDTEVISRLAAEQDAHLRYYVTPGVSVEELFATGGKSKIPLEVKIQCLWGKVHHMWFIGEDSRGCKVQSGAFQLYADKTGWDLKGIVNESTKGFNDPLTDHILDKYFDRLVAAAEAFSTGVGADIMRADFFIGIPESGEAVLAMNEPESVSGMPYWHDRQQIASIVRDGYILSDRIKLGEAPSSKWDQIMKRTQSNRTANSLE